MGSSTQKRTISSFLFVLSTHLALQVSSLIAPYDCSMWLNFQPITESNASLEERLPFTRGTKSFNGISPLEKEKAVVCTENEPGAQGGASHELHKVPHRLSGGPADFGTTFVRKESERSKNRAGSSSKSRNGHAGDPQGS